MRQRQYFDVDEIRDALPVSELLEQANIFIKGNRGTCPLCDGSNPTQFSIYVDDTRWKCHTCGQGGDVFTFIMAKQDVPFAVAVAAAAMLAGIAPGPPPDPAVIAKRAAEREKKVAAHAAEAVVKRDLATKLATDHWWDLHQRWWNDSQRRRRCADYLATRGLAAFLQAEDGIAGNVSHILRAEADGSPATPIHSFNTICDPLPRNAIVGVAWRQVTPQAASKVLVGTGHKTEGTFGESWRLATSDDYDRTVVVEGVIDFLTALLVFESWLAFPGRPVFSGKSLVLGAHSVGRISQVVARLADDPKIGERFRKLPVLLVTHIGDTSHAGENAEAEAMREASLRGMEATRFDLAGEKDLNDWFVARTGL